MYDTMTLTKIAASFCGALLVFLLVAWTSESLFHTGVHGEASFVMETDDDSSTDATADEAVPFDELLAAADPGAGERLWRACQACHALDGTDGTGPHLNGVVGRDIASVGGYGYSNTLQGLEGNWTPEELNGFIESPRNYASGTSMTYNGMRKVEDRADLISYLGTTN